ncbi:4-hydroxyphenylacetate decarboxylase small subunit [Sporomusa sp.]|uniref:4-hydroxyphenylacetate decarboxylase small subunit n=1 Tax=Sporomusa sp. TaxID=2078658 RepID=UPI002CC0BA5B|nr:4-hydroxyphenylacetate decarboxylase small subunit [Sporomusa sp.]HWR44851.1 4-hydroxyphenylacetate decarboxylase small subunit [Sporomusa sp.]
MAELLKQHNDCDNFAAVDVTKGICRLTNELVLIDSQICVKFDAIPKCSGCSFFQHPDKEGIGTCTGLQKEYWTAANYNAALCEGYVGK